MAKDVFHDVVKEALISDGWEVTHDPYVIKTLGTNVNIDLGAEKLIAAEKNKTFIVVEIKSFINPSFTYDFHLAVGQYLNYLRAIRKNDPLRSLYLAVPQTAFDSFFVKPEVWEAVEEFKMSVLVFDDLSKAIIHWFEHHNK